MFYFGGMTLGYLVPPAAKAKGNYGDTMAGNGQAEATIPPLCDHKPGLKELIARANWFSLYW